MVYCIGETVYDIIFKEDDPVAARPGGSMLNTAISLGRAGIPVTFISETGLDQTGNRINAFLEKNGVSAQYVRQYPGFYTTIALAFLDEKNNASYSFYRSFPEQREIKLPPVISKADIVLFGSFYSISGEIRRSLLEFLIKAGVNDALVIYDPNFRKPHLDELPTVLPRIRENISLADIVRGSDEDFLTIFNTGNGKNTYTELKKSGCFTLVYTKNRDGVEIHTGKFSLVQPVKAVEPVSTIGAGDSFNAGLIYRLVKNGVTRQALPDLDRQDWEGISASGIRFAADVCMSFDNYISEKLAKSIAR